jgi:AcrR family transcriptional regulator
MPNQGLREIKKARTRQHIADTAARLFAERGYENVAVSEIAEAAEVSVQTVFNYFGTKERLVTDREEQIEERMSELIRSRPAGVTPAAAVRDFVLAAVDGIRDVPKELWPGELGHLAAISPAVRRLALELTDRQGAALGAAIAQTSAVAPEIAGLQGRALAGVFQLIIGEAGARTVRGHSQAKIVRELRPLVESVLGELDRWFTLSAAQAKRTTAKSSRS